MPNIAWMHHTGLGVARMHQTMTKNKAEANPTTQEGYCAMGTQATNKQLAKATHAKSSAVRRDCPLPTGLKTPGLWMN
jgi:hypothetical protein